MRSFLRDRKGQIRVIEAFFAAVLMLSSLALIPTIQKSTFSPSNSVLSSKALETLISLDRDGQLAHLTDQRDWTALKNCLESVIPAALWFNLTVFDDDMAPINAVFISNGGAISGHVEAADYLTTSTSGTYAIYTFRLQLAGLD